MTNEEVIRKAHEEFALRGLSHYTVEEYLGILHMFLNYYENRSLETMGEQEIRNFLLYQIEVGKRPGCVNNYNSALRFIFGAVLERNLNCRMIPRQRDRRAFPAIMSKDEIVRFFSVIDNLRDRTIFETVYGGGLRVSEIAHLRIQDIDSKQMRIFRPERDSSPKENSLPSSSSKNSSAESLLSARTVDFPVCSEPIFLRQRRKNCKASKKACWAGLLCYIHLTKRWGALQ